MMGIPCGKWGATPAALAWAVGATWAVAASPALPRGPETFDERDPNALVDAAPVPAATCAERAALPMPDLRGYALRGDPRVHVGGKVIKGLYYSERGDGPNDLVAFRLACFLAMEPRPFLVLDFRTDEYALDADRDGCADRTGRVPSGEIDPADFLAEVEGWGAYCHEDRDET